MKQLAIYLYWIGVVLFTSYSENDLLFPDWLGADLARVSSLIKRLDVFDNEVIRAWVRLHDRETNVVRHTI